MTKTVPPTTDTGELTGYAVTAAELRRIADALDTLPTAVGLERVQLSILPEKTVAAVDAVAMAVFGKPGKGERNGRDWYHVRRTDPNGYDPVGVSIFAIVPGPPDERDVELERLRAELAAALKPAAYGREVDNGDVAAEVPTGVEGGPVTGRAQPDPAATSPAAGS